MHDNYEERKKEQEKFFNDKKRDDKLVIKKDLLYILGEEKYDKYVENAQNIEQLIEEAQNYLYPKKNLFLLSPYKHQKVADSIAAYVIITLIECEEKRREYLVDMIKNAKAIARTNYQFVRTFLRKNFAVLFLNTIKYFTDALGNC